MTNDTPSDSPFTPGPPLDPPPPASDTGHAQQGGHHNQGEPNQGGPGGGRRRRRRRGGRGRNRGRGGQPGGGGDQRNQQGQHQGGGGGGGQHQGAFEADFANEDAHAALGGGEGDGDSGDMGHSGGYSHHGAPIRPDAPPHPPVELPQAFAALGLEPALLYALAEIRFVKPSEIQEKLIPVALQRRDVLGQARTGTGKTAAFGLPILQNLDLNIPFQAICIVPTRELAVQVEAELVRFAKHKPVRFALAYGGTKMSGQMKLMGRHPHVVVGTPGRIIDLWERGALPLGDMRFVVCDEVDRMFDIGFRDDIRKILGACGNNGGPRQTIFVSATISDEIERMVHKHMHDPVRVFTSDPEEQLTNPQAVQYYVGVNPWDKQRALRMLMKQERPDLAIVFCRTKRSVDKVAAGLNKDGIAASPIHGDLMQNKRERVMRGFKTGKIHVLVATDLASRGIDVHEITHVINYDIPEDPEVYVHRVGRTARMGATGKAFTFVAHGQAQMQTEIEKLINHLLEEYKIDGFVPAPEPSSRRNAPPPPPGVDRDEDEHQAEAPLPGQAPAAPAPASNVQEGYMPTSFTDVQPTQSRRPITGRFPTKRRR